MAAIAGREDADGALLKRAGIVAVHANTGCGDVRADVLVVQPQEGRFAPKGREIQFGR